MFCERVGQSGWCGGSASHFEKRRFSGSHVNQHFMLRETTGPLCKHRPRYWPAQKLLLITCCCICIENSKAFCLVFVLDTPVIYIFATLTTWKPWASVCCVLRLLKNNQRTNVSLHVPPVNHSVCLLPHCRGPLPVTGQSVLPEGCGERERLPDEHRVQRLLPGVSHQLMRNFGRSVK